MEGDDLISEFLQVTSAEYDDALEYLEKADWDLTTALSLYFEKPPKKKKPQKKEEPKPAAEAEQPFDTKFQAKRKEATQANTWLLLLYALDFDGLEHQWVKEIIAYRYTVYKLTKYHKEAEPITIHYGIDVEPTALIMDPVTGRVLATMKNCSNPKTFAIWLREFLHANPAKGVALMDSVEASISSSSLLELGMQSQPVHSQAMASSQTMASSQAMIGSQPMTSSQKRVPVELTVMLPSRKRVKFTLDSTATVKQLKREIARKEHGIATELVLVVMPYEVLNDDDPIAPLKGALIRAEEA